MGGYTLEHLTGLSSELYVASYFAEQGYEVHWPLLTQSRADFVIEKDNVFQKVQIKTASWIKSGKYKYLQARLKSSNKYPRLYREDEVDFVVFKNNTDLWLAPFKDIEGLTSVCLAGTNPNYKNTSSLYDPQDWRIT